MRLKSVISTMIVGLLLLGGVAACSPAPSSDEPIGIHGTRSKEYVSVADLASDSTAVIVGKVLTQEVIPGDVPTTLSTFEVQEAPAPAVLASALHRPATAKVPALKTVQIRQLGTSTMAEVPAAIFKADGTVYMVFIRPSELPGEAATHFFVTGSDAGIFPADQAGAFTHKNGEVNDKLPSKITKQEVSNLK